MAWDNLEEAFKDLDAKEFTFFARCFGAYTKALEEEGFTRKEAMRLVESYAKFIYDMSIEDFMNRQAVESAEDDDDEEDLV